MKAENVEPLGIMRLRCERAEAASATLRGAPENLSLLVSGSKDDTDKL